MFFDVGWGELLLIGLVALIFVGPKELPGLMRGIGNFIHKVKAMAASFQQQFERAVEEGEIGKIRTEVEDIGREMSPDKLMGELDRIDEYEQFDPDCWNEEILERERQLAEFERRKGLPHDEAEGRDEGDVSEDPAGLGEDDAKAIAPVDTGKDSA